jgi:hypothetical protein
MGRWNRNASTVEAEAQAALARAQVERAAAAAEAARNQEQVHQDFIERAANAHAIQKAERKAREAAQAPADPAPVADLPMLVLEDSVTASDADSEESAEALSIDTETAVKRELVEWLTSNHPAHGEDDPIVLMREKRAHLVELVEGVLASPHQPQ